MELICEKGIGKTHAKWSPVCTAWYRMQPDIKFNEPVKNKDAKLLKKTCPMGVFDIEDIGNNEYQAVVKDARKCTTCRECIRNTDEYSGFNQKVNLGKRKDVFEFHVESVGMYKPEDIVFQSLIILKEKANKWLNILQE